MALMSQPHWFHGVTKAWRDVTVPIEGKQMQATHIDDMRGQELAQEHSSSVATPIAI